MYKRQDYIAEKGQDYRYEDAESPVKALRDRQRDNTKPVSYTHLDVYKRQLHTCAHHNLLIGHYQHTPSCAYGAAVGTIAVLL